MIPVSANGHMPFLASSKNPTAAKTPTKIINVKLVQPNPVRTTTPSSLFNNTARRRSSGASSCGSSCGSYPACKKPSIMKHIDQSSGTPQLSKAGREEIMSRDHSWKIFLKVLFRSKQKQDTAPKAATTTSLTIPQATSAPVTMLNAPLRTVRRPRTRQCPLQRSHSLHATKRHIALLEAIMEEESLAAFMEEGDTRASNDSLNKGFLGANPLNRLLSADSNVSDEPIQPLEQLIKNVLIMSAEPAPEVFAEHAPCAGDQMRESVNPL